MHDMNDFHHVYDLKEDSGLEILYSFEKQSLFFSSGIECPASTNKYATKMTSLLYDARGINLQELCYSGYPNIYRRIDFDCLRARDMLYGFTVIQPGMLNSEYLKTSGHIHGKIPGSIYPYPEIYEVLHGTAVFLLQQVELKDEKIVKINKVYAVMAKKKEAIIIPPFFAHCSINIGDEPLIFSNIAAGSCPLIYPPIKEKHGLGYYLLQDSKGNLPFKAVQNPYYDHLPPLTICHLQPVPELGIDFKKPIYTAYVEHPEKFDFLNHPDECMDLIEGSIVEEG